MTTNDTQIDVSRRQFLQSTGVGAFGVASAGCLGGGGNGDETIRYISRGGVTHNAERELMEEWSAESGVSVEHQEAAADDEMMNLIAENPGDIDFANPAPWGFTVNQIDYDGELLADIDYDQVPNYRDIIQDDWQEAFFIEDHDMGLMYYISTQGLGYNTDKADIRSWQDIKDPEYEDAVTLYDSAPARFGNCCAALGYDVAEAAQDDEMFEDVLEEMEEQDVNVFNYWATGDEYMRLLREERADIASAWGGRVIGLQEDGHPMDYIVPEEGAVTWSVAFAVTEESENKETVYELLNWIYQRENLEQLSANHNYPVPMEDPPEDITDLPDYTDSPDDLVWIDWEAFLPVYEDINQRLDEIKTS